MRLRLRNPFSTRKKLEKKSDSVGSREDKGRDNDADIAHDNPSQQMKVVSKQPEKNQSDKKARESKKSGDETGIRSRNALEKLAYSIVSPRLQRIPGYKEIYEQSGISIIYESYISTGMLLSAIIAIPVFIVSLLLEIRFLPRTPIVYSAAGSVILGSVIFATSFLFWLLYPMSRRRSFKSMLENQLAYSFGVIGVLSAAGLYIDRLFENLASSESNPVLAELAKRFLRNVKVFGLDFESALKEVADHSPSISFSKMLSSIAVAFRTTGSVHDLVMFESTRLLQEKRDRLKKTTGNLAVMAELYITLVVVGPIIFIVMMAIFGLLPAGGLPNPVFVINLIVFIGIPALSVMMILLLDSVVTKA